MKTPALRSASLLVGLTVLVGLAAASRPGPESPPLSPGNKLYRIEFSRPQAEILPELGPANPLEVREVRGSWVLLDSPGIPRGPMWFNFDQVVRFSFER